jgi:carboxypeptidase Q
MVCLEALHVLASLGLRPKRTIRFIAWSGEEMGLPGNGADQYMVKHASEIEHHVLAFESDEGTTKPYGFGFSGGPNGL